VLRHPIAFAGMVVKKFGIALSKLGDSSLKFLPARFWNEQEAHNDRRWEKNPALISMLYERDRDAYRAMVTERLQRPIVVAEEPRQTANAVVMQALDHYRHLAWVKQSRENDPRFPTLHFTWFAALGFLGLARSLIPAHFQRAVLLVLPCAFYLTLVYTVGDSRERYLLPLEWILLLFGVLGLDWIFEGIRRLSARFARAPQLSAAPSAVSAGAAG